MNSRFEQLQRLFASAALLALAACGGGGDVAAPVAGAPPPAPVPAPAPAPTPTPAPPPAPTATNVSTTVIDGAIQNALVCIDKNSNGKCDSAEVQGKTDASGNVTLAVPNADVGKYPIIAVVGTDAVDAEHGAVTQAYTLSAPADQTGVISPLTTLVQQTVATTGATTADAAAAVQQATGINVSLFQDFTKVAAPTNGSVSAAAVARMLVVTTQQQAAAVASTVGTPAVDGAAITQADLDKAIQKKLLELLPALVAALSDPAVLAATTPAAKDTALVAAATALVTSVGLTPASVPTVVAINTQTSAAPPAEPTTVTAGFNLRNLNFSDAQNYFYRVFSSSVAQATPDAGNNTRYVDRRVSSNTGNVATWGTGSDPTRGADLHWNGSAWANCPVNFENTSSVRDAQGNSVYNFCDGFETGKSNRATFDVSGRSLASVYAQIRAAGYTNLTLASPTVLGSATFPTGSSLFYQTSTPLTEAIGYYPGGAGNPDGTSNVATQYSAAVSAGGTASTQAANTACNSAEANTTKGTSSTTLEGLVAAKKGTPCVYAQGSLVYGGITYTSDASNEWWGNSTAKLGTVSLNSGTTTPGYYSGNTLLRVAFTGSGTNPVTYYACKEHFTDGSTRNCKVIGNGTYTISTLGDGRALTLNNPPAQAASLTYNRVFIERGGFVYLGYQNKPIVSSTARLNNVGSTALLTQLGLTPVDPAVPIALTIGSYQGTWDLRNSGSPFSASNGLTIIINANGTNVCQTYSGAQFGCTLSLSASTGAFAVGDSSGSLTGTLDFLTGIVSGTNIVGSRR